MRKDLFSFLSVHKSPKNKLGKKEFFLGQNRKINFMKKEKGKERGSILCVGREKNGVY
jgi:hypothetical protein